MKLVVGLGNVGSQYRSTRHNAGFMVVDELAKTFDSPWNHEAKLRSEVARGEIDGEKIILAKPTTMMNASGEAIQRLMQFYKLVPRDIFVVFDDVDTSFGRLKVRQGGGSSGHQGINSTIASVGPNFIRVKFGISLNDRAVEPSEVYVLRSFNEREQVELPQLITNAGSLLATIMTQPIIEADSYDLRNI